ncbi:MAG TPA: response regulator [Pyrinomonadaceae bacterium]|nr:response regulator [Pyrinomonadaceae bacterium]
MFLESAGISREGGAVADSTQAATILLVEDEERVREVMELTLSLSGYQVLSARGALEALEIIEGYDDAIHLMVTDFAMPHMNGADLAARLKRVRPEAKVLYVSGFPKQDVQSFHDRNARAGIEFLQKPFAPEELEEKVMAILADET